MSTRKFNDSGKIYRFKVMQFDVRRRRGAPRLRVRVTFDRSPKRLHTAAAPWHPGGQSRPPLRKVYRGAAVNCLSLRHGFAVTPPSQREARTGDTDSHGRDAPSE